MRSTALRHGLTGVTGIVLAVALVVMVNWLGARHWVRADWTSSELYTLSEKSRAILSDLDEDVRAIVFMVPGSPLYDQARELLARFESVSDRIRVEYIDPDREPLKTRQLAEEFGVSLANTVVFTVGDRSRHVTSDQMAEYDYAGAQYGGQPEMAAFRGEEEFTSAILSLVAPDVPKVYFVTGHGEASLEAAGGGLADRSLTDLEAALERDTIDAADVSLMTGEIPDDADVLAVIGPTRPFTEAEIDVLDGWLADGGRLLVALDPLIDPSGTMRATRLEPLLARHGVEVRDDLVVDPSRRLPFYDLSAVYLTDFTDHPVTRGLEGIAVLFTVTRSLAATGDDGVPLVETTAEGWGETDLAPLLTGEPVELEASDHAGPVAVGVAVGAENREEEGPELPGDEAVDEPAGDLDEQPDDDGKRLVVFGDSDFLTDLEFGNAGNQTLAMNAFNWLATREQALGIPPRQVDRVSLFLTEQQLQTILLIVLVGMPGAAIVVGIVVWRRRRH